MPFSEARPRISRVLGENRGQVPLEIGHREMGPIAVDLVLDTFLHIGPGDSTKVGKRLGRQNQNHIIACAIGRRRLQHFCDVFDKDIFVTLVVAMAARDVRDMAALRHVLRSMCHFARRLEVPLRHPRQAKRNSVNRIELRRGTIADDQPGYFLFM